MKKGLFIIGLLGILITVSCKKNYVCSCTIITVNGGIETELPKQDSSLSDMTKKDAINTCNEKDSFTNEGNTQTTKNCELN